MKTLIISALALALAAPAAAQAPATPAEPTVKEIMKWLDDLYRGDSSTGTMVMNVKTSRWERKLKMRSWTEGTEKSLMRILEPKKERGVSTLKVGKNIWNYLPKVDRTIKVPGSMMSGSWMGSHFTNDDLVQESRYSEDFKCEVKGRDKGWNLVCIPNPDAAVVWGRVELQVGADKIPVAYRFYDEGGDLIRTMEFHDVKDVGGRKIPSRMRLVPADKPSEFTEIIYGDMQFNVKIPKEVFTLQALKR
jgi:outer membrane lipoprotein-sorting protein